MFNGISISFHFNIASLKLEGHFKGSFYLKKSTLHQECYHLGHKQYNCVVFYKALFYGCSLWRVILC